MLVRRDDWPVRLAEFIEVRRATPFQWGKSDCCVFVADAIVAMTDTDILAPWRDTYQSEKGALRVLRDYGDLIGFANSALLPDREAAVALAGRGDVVAVDSPRGVALALHIGNAIVGQGINGVEFLPVTSAKRVWKI